MSPDDPRHGTYAGANQHWTDGEPTCEPCKRAATRYAKARRLASTGPLTFSSLGAARRIHALQRIGWPLSEIAERIGWRTRSRTRLHTVTLGDRKITADLHDRIAAVYEELSMTLGPSVRSRNYAIRQGWLPPLAWNNIDDPNERPEIAPATDENSIDDAVVERILAGDRIQATAAEKREAMRRWVAGGRSARSLALAQGWHDGRYAPRKDGAA